MKPAYPRYTVWQDHRTGDFEIIRWDSSCTFQIVQTNIRSRAKAHQARLDWNARENEAQTQPATSRRNPPPLQGRHIRQATGLRIRGRQIDDLDDCQ